MDKKDRSQITATPVTASQITAERLRLCEHIKASVDVLGPIFFIDPRIKLLEERDKLVARLAEIDQQLSELEDEK